MTNPAAGLGLGQSAPPHSQLHLGRAADAIVYVSAAGDDNNSGNTWGTAKLTLAAAIAALPTGTSGQPVGKVIIGAGTFSTSITLEYGYGTTTGGFTLEGIGKGLSNLVYTGSGTGMRPATYSTAEQKKYVNLKGFTLTAANAAVGVDAKGSTYGDFDIEVIGAPTIGSVVAGSIGIKLDASYGALIGCWWNKVEHCRVSGWARPIKLTGSVGAGQANENKILNNRINAYTDCGIDSDIGDNNQIEGNDCTTGTAGTVPTVAAIRANGLAIKVKGNRFENIGSGGICVLLDGVGTKVADRCIVDENVFATEAGSIAVQINANARENTIGLGQMFSRSPAVTPVVDNGLGGLTTWSTYGRGLDYHRFSVADITASMASVAIDPAGAIAGNSRLYLGRPYQIRGILVRLSAALTAGTLTITPTIAGAAAGLSLAVTSASGTATGVGQDMALDADTGSGGLGVNITTSGTLAPAGSVDLSVFVIVEFTQ